MPSPPSTAPATFRDTAPPIQIGSEIPTITTPYTEDERIPFRRSDKAIVVSAQKCPTISQLRNWKTRVGHGLTAVPNYSDQAEYGWFLQVNKKSSEELDGRGNEPRFGLLDAP